MANTSILKRETGKGDRSPMNNVYEITSTPFPALVNAFMLVATPLVSPQTEAPAAVTTKSRFLLTKLGSQSTKVGLSSKNALLFGAAQAAGAWMIHDKDLEDASGFLMAWSSLFLIVNGKQSLQALKYGRVWPLSLSTVAVASSLVYGKRFISGGFQ